MTSGRKGEILCASKISFCSSTRNTATYKWRDHLIEAITRAVKAPRPIEWEYSRKSIDIAEILFTANFPPWSIFVSLSLSLGRTHVDFFLQILTNDPGGQASRPINRSIYSPSYHHCVQRNQNVPAPSSFVSIFFLLLAVTNFPAILLHQRASV